MSTPEDGSSVETEDLELLSVEELRDLIKAGTSLVAEITGGDLEIASTKEVQTSVARRAHAVLMQKIEKEIANSPNEWVAGC